VFEFLYPLRIAFVLQGKPSLQSIHVHPIEKILNSEEGESNKQYLPSTQREMIQSQQSVSQLNKDTDSMVAKQILCKTRVCVALLPFTPLKTRFGEPREVKVDEDFWAYVADSGVKKFL
jgi:hypothetical protein